MNFGIVGSTDNANGAAGMTDGPPKPRVPLVNYRMAGDVMSAANTHVGEVMTLASREGVRSLCDGRYLDAAASVHPPNVPILIAMPLGGHGGERTFSSRSHQSGLDPDYIQDAVRRYAGCGLHPTPSSSPFFDSRCGA